LKPDSELHPVSTCYFSFGGDSDPFLLESGESLPGVTLAYETYGELNADRSNAILVFHAMTGSQHAAGWNEAVPDIGSRWTEECQVGWWDLFVGPDKAFDTSRYFIICANYLGGCYGSTGPASINPATDQPYGASFPRISLGDILESQIRLLDHLGISRLLSATGASLGGMLTLLLATRYPKRLQTAIPIASGMDVPPLQRILNFEQILAIESDPDFAGGDYYPKPGPLRGLALARMIAHKSFISLSALDRRARHEVVVEQNHQLASYQLSSPHESYMLHQGEKFTSRFDANTYLRILSAWQNFQLSPKNSSDSLIKSFQRCRNIHFLLFTIDSDVCFYPEQQEQLACVLQSANVPFVRLTVHSDKGHDAFLLEPELFHPHIVRTLEERISRAGGAG